MSTHPRATARWWARGSRRWTPTPSHVSVAGQSHEPYSGASLAKAQKYLDALAGKARKGASSSY